jgi:putative flippase GtrA
LPTLAPGRVAQLARFCLVGLTCYVLNILTLAALCELLGMHYIVAYVIVFFLGCAVGYWLNKHFTFSLRAPLDAKPTGNTRDILRQGKWPSQNTTGAVV